MNKENLEEGFYRGKKLKDMSREELIEIFN